MEISLIDDTVPLKSFIKNETVTSVYFRYKNHYIQVSVNRLKKANQIRKYVKKFKLSKPALNYNIKALGFRLAISDERVDVFSYSNKPIMIGEKQWVYNVTKSNNKTSNLFFINLTVTSCDRAYNVDITTSQKISAALAIYKASCDKAELILRHDLERVYSSVYIKSREDTLEPLTEHKTQPKQPKKGLVRFKKA